jgi:uroporphyrinogen-III synthase
MELQLKDKIFISTRPANSSKELALLFKKAGATLLQMPLIKIIPNPLNESEKKIISYLEEFQWLFFTSSNGVKYFFENLKKDGENQQLPTSIQIAVIGNKTEKALNDLGYQASFKNPGSTGEDFANAFIEKIKDKSKPNILLALGNIARTVIQDKLIEFANYTRMNVYQTTAVESVDKQILQRIEKDHYEMLLFTSPSGIENFLKLGSKLPKKNIRIACIGRTTANAAIKNNIEPKVIAKNSTASGLYESIVNYYIKINHQKIQA